MKPLTAQAIFDPWHAASVHRRVIQGLAQWGRLAALPLGLFIFAAIWLAELSWTSLAPPFDNIEQITWVGALELGYYKHPPLPTWVFWPAAYLFGASGWTTYVTGAVVTLGSALLMWRLLVELRGRRHAVVGLLSALCITYYNGRLYYYNHNVVLLLFVSASAYACWRAVMSGRRRWWLALGATVGLGFLSKYQMAVAVCSGLVFWFQQRAWRDPVQRQGVALAALVATLIFLPHALWLVTHDFAPVHYAMSSSLGVGLSGKERLLDSAHWLVDQLLNRALPCWLLLLAAAWSCRHAPRSELVVRRDDAARSLLISWGAVPLIFMPVVGLLFGADLQLQWGTPFLLFSAPAVMELWQDQVNWSQVARWPLLRAFVVIQAIMLGVNMVTSPRGPSATRDNHWRDFDSSQLAATIEGPAHRELGGRVCVVSGPAIVAGALALAMHDRPQVLIDGRYDISPWVNRQSTQGCGVLELADHPGLPGAKPVGRRFPRLFWRVVRAQPQPQ